MIMSKIKERGSCNAERLDKRLLRRILLLLLLNLLLLLLVQLALDLMFLAICLILLILRTYVSQGGLVARVGYVALLRPRRGRCR